MVIIAGKFMPSVLKLPEGTKLMACKGDAVPRRRGYHSVAHDELREHVVLGVVSGQQARGDAGLPRIPEIGAGGG